MSKEWHRVELNMVGIGDPDDPEIYVSLALDKWENTEEGRWCRERNLEIRYSYVMQEHMYGQAVRVSTVMDGPTYTEWLLKFGSNA